MGLQVRANLRTVIKLVLMFMVYIIFRTLSIYTRFCHLHSLKFGQSASSLQQPYLLSTLYRCLGAGLTTNSTKRIQAQLSYFWFAKEV